MPLHGSTLAALRRYVARRDRLCVRLGRWLFTSTVGTRVIHQNLLHVFRRLARRAGIARRPRLHDIRHTFAVNTVRDWYRSGTDVERRLFSLSTYLGHVSPTSTYWYLTATPELLALAGERLERWRSRR